ncbi:unnamed protein product [Prunus armeniaca]|uniref:Acid phosphatase n=1 Tax=Prunus armeniaca TaxID=36596 RepID=A0A6J5U8F1_PRUAR|nr:unnamed protein product [Prunus armeniaca]
MSYIMEILPVALVFFLATIVSTTQGYEPVLTHHIHLLTPKTGGARGSVPGLSCLSWRLAVETNNIINWKTVPAECEGYVGHYMLGHQYRKDSKVVTNGAWLYAKSLDLTKDGKNVWVFDIDETTLSNLPYYAVNGFGTELYNSTSFNEWVLKGTAPALPESLKLYQKLLTLGVKVVFLTGRGEGQRNVTTTNLKNVGYHTWEKLILKGSAYTGKTSYVYKSAERTKLVKSGFRIIGNAGDQWSDILGTNVGNRTFKVPDPMKDSKVVTNEAWLYAKSLNLTNDGKNVWVFDIDETTLSNLPYYADHGFGTELYNSTAFNTWVLEGTAPALPESLKLYKKLLKLGVKIVFITGRGEDQRNVTTTNLKNVGYHTWEKLVLKGSTYSGNTSYVHKSAERTKLVKSGFRIIGNIGDQWSDILGTNVGNRTFKLPDPMYYIS